MLFNLNEFLMSVSFALDFVEIDILGVSSNHGKRTAYICLQLAKAMNFTNEELHDIVALAILHDNGISEKSLHDRYLKLDTTNSMTSNRIKEHCTIGDENICLYPFLTSPSNVIKYHHENVDGSGYFKLKENEIPLMAQIIRMADTLEVNFQMNQQGPDVLRQKAIAFVTSQEHKMFSSDLVNAFLRVAVNLEFWQNLKDSEVYNSIKQETPQYSLDIPFEKVQEITGVFSRIIDSKSEYTQRHSRELSNKVGIMADYYQFDNNKKCKLKIAANLHDIGKLAVPNTILDSPNKLSDAEFEIVKSHPYHTRQALSQIKGFEDVTEWAANHHEKLNGTGYPFGKRADELDFESRLMACLDIYEALTEERPYRHPLSHEEAMNILNNMKEQGLIDPVITADIDQVFSQLKDLS